MAATQGIIWISEVFICIGGLPVAVTCGMAVYFALCAPERLQSEDYQLRQAALDLIREKGVAVPVEPSSINAIANPLSSGRA